MGDYSFFIKSATFLILVNAAIVGYPDLVESFTDGTINTSSLQGTEVDLGVSLGQANNEQVVELSNPVSQENIAFNSDGNIIQRPNKSSGTVEYNISKFGETGSGSREVYVDAFSDYEIGLLGLYPDQFLKAEYEDSNGLTNFTMDKPVVLDDVQSDTVKFYFQSNEAVIRSIEDSTSIEHTAEEGVLGSARDEYFEDSGLGRFTGTVDSLVSLYTSPSSGNRVLGAIFTLYLLGFIVFILKEVVPG